MSKQDSFVESLFFVLNQDVPKSLPPLFDTMSMFQAKQKGAWIDTEPKGDRTPDLEREWRDRVREGENDEVG
jgi:hypothetical protein